MGHTLPQITLMLASGIFIWTLMEYTLHRFLFHIQTKTYWGNTIHYLLHGCHHKHPMDDLRLVFPPTAIAILCLLVRGVVREYFVHTNQVLIMYGSINGFFDALMQFYSLVRFLSTPTVAPALFGGFLLGYVIYDCTHYYLHHGQPTTSQGRYLKVHTT